MRFFSFSFPLYLGQERFHALGPIYYRDSNGALLIYDITDRDSFTKVRNWVRELRKIVGKDIVLLIIGNKEDLEKKRQVDMDEADQYAKSVGAEHMLVSAKTGKNVEQIFLELTKQMLKTKENASGGSNALTGGDEVVSSRRPGGRGRQSVDITMEPEQKSGGCC